MRNLIVVAHPDDEFIFFHNLITKHPKFDWDILSMTYRMSTPRGQEFCESCNTYNAQPLFAGLEDNFQGGLFENKPKVDVHEGTIFSAITGLQLNLTKYANVYTHNPNGEYGHRHHIETCEFVTRAQTFIHKLWYTAYNYQIPELVCQDKSKLDAKHLQIYERELYIIMNFDLITEGFVRA